MKKQLLKRLIVLVFAVPLLVFALLILVIVWKQDDIVQELIATANADFIGELEIEDSHVSPFINFPYVSIDLDHVRIFEDKEKKTAPLMDVDDVYLGFDILDLLRGKMEIKSIKVSEGII
jgi:uncharacterized protein involved in outer membrane biogenesis